jgi:hypothetical protein
MKVSVHYNKSDFGRSPTSRKLLCVWRLVWHLDVIFAFPSTSGSCYNVCPLWLWVFVGVTRFSYKLLCWLYMTARKRVHTSSLCESFCFRKVRSESRLFVCCFVEFGVESNFAISAASVGNHIPTFRSKCLNSFVFWIIARRKVLWNRRFGTSYLFHFYRQAYSRDLGFRPPFSA